MTAIPLIVALAITAQAGEATSAPAAGAQSAGGWFVVINGSQTGPLDDAALKAKAAAGEVDAASLVWKDGMAGWKPASEVPEAAALLEGAKAQVASKPGTWFFALDGKQEGPFELGALQEKVKAGQLKPESLVWKDGMAEWKPAKEQPELQPLFAAGPAGAAPAWYALVDGKQEGPYEAPAIEAKAKTQALTAETYFWRDGMAGWAKGKDVPELQGLFPAAVAQQPQGEKVIQAYGDTPVAAAAPKEEKKKEALFDHTVFGIGLDGGFPSMAALSLVGRPLKWLRVSGAYTSSVLASGLRGGVTFVPFYFPISPSVSFEMGHFFGANLGDALAPIGLPVDAVVLQDVTVDYINGSLGLEVGSPKRFLFFLHGGLTSTQLSINGFEEGIRTVTNDPTIEARPLRIRYVGPSAKLGFVVFIL